MLWFLYLLEHLIVASVVAAFITIYQKHGVNGVLRALVKVCHFSQNLENARPTASWFFLFNSNFVFSACAFFLVWMICCIPYWVAKSRSLPEKWKDRTTHLQQESHRWCRYLKRVSEAVSLPQQFKRIVTRSRGNKYTLTQRKDRGPPITWSRDTIMRHRNTHHVIRIPPLQADPPPSWPPLGRSPWRHVHDSIRPSRLTAALGPKLRRVHELKCLRNEMSESQWLDSLPLYGTLQASQRKKYWKKWTNWKREN